MRALLRADSADDELAQALARAGLYVERLADPAEAEARIADGEVAVVDPRLLQARSERPRAPRVRSRPRALEALCYERLSELLDRLGDQRLPALYDTVLQQMERALLRAALERRGGLVAAAEALGIHRNTLARRLEALGLRERASKKAGSSRRTP